MTEPSAHYPLPAAETIALATITVPPRLRAVDPAKIDTLQKSMQAVGLLNPITLWRDPNGATLLVAGAHRLQAAHNLGWPDIQASVYHDGNKLDMELREIDENLCRSPLTPQQEAEHLLRRKEIWELQHVDNQAGQVVQPEIGYKQPPPQSTGFAADTATVTGQSQRDINRKTRRAADICLAARNLIRGSRLDKGTFLDQLASAHLDPDQQVQQVQSALEESARKQQEQSAARDARRAAKKAAGRKKPQVPAGPDRDAATDGTLDPPTDADPAQLESAPNEDDAVPGTCVPLYASTTNQSSRIEATVSKIAALAMELATYSADPATIANAAFKSPLSEQAAACLDAIASPEDYA